MDDSDMLLRSIIYDFWADKFSISYLVMVKTYHLLNKPEFFIVEFDLEGSASNYISRTQVINTPCGSSIV